MELINLKDIIYPKKLHTDKVCNKKDKIDSFNAYNRQAKKQKFGLGFICGLIVRVKSIN